MDSGPITIQQPPRSTRARLLRWGIMTVIFAGGSVAGFCVGTMQLIERVTPPNPTAQPNKFTAWMLGQLKKDLKLTDAQCPKVEKIILQHHAAFNAEMAAMDRDMLAVLDEPQRQLYKQRMQRGPWRGRPGGGGRRGSDHKDKNHEQKDNASTGEKSKQAAPKDAAAHQASETPSAGSGPSQ